MVDGAEPRPPDHDERITQARGEVGNGKPAPQAARANPQRPRRGRHRGRPPGAAPARGSGRARPAGPRARPQRRGASGAANAYTHTSSAGTSKPPSRASTAASPSGSSARLPLWTGLQTPTASPRSRRAWPSAAVTTVLPTPVSVAVTNSPWLRGHAQSTATGSGARIGPIGAPRLLDREAEVLDHAVVLGRRLTRLGQVVARRRSRSPGTAPSGCSERRCTSRPAESADLAVRVHEPEHGEHAQRERRVDPLLSAPSSGVPAIGIRKLTGIDSAPSGAQLEARRRRAARRSRPCRRSRPSTARCRTPRRPRPSPPCRRTCGSCRSRRSGSRRC